MYYRFVLQQDSRGHKNMKAIIGKKVNLNFKMWSHELNLKTK